MNTVTYNTRITNETETVSEAHTCTENKAFQQIETALLTMKQYGFNTASGDGWYTATNPKSGTSFTGTITH